VIEKIKASSYPAKIAGDEKEDLVVREKIPKGLEEIKT
jgi:hypothetical protein